MASGFNHQWSILSTMQLGQYAEYLAKMRIVQAGWEVGGWLAVAVRPQITEKRGF